MTKNQHDNKIYTHNSNKMQSLRWCKKWFVEPKEKMNSTLIPFQLATQIRAWKMKKQHKEIKSFALAISHNLNPTTRFYTINHLGRRICRINGTKQALGPQLATPTLSLTFSNNPKFDSVIVMKSFPANPSHFRWWSFSLYCPCSSKQLWFLCRALILGHLSGFLTSSSVRLPKKSAIREINENNRTGWNETLANSNQWSTQWQQTRIKYSPSWLYGYYNIYTYIFTQPASKEGFPLLWFLYKNL